PDRGRLGLPPSRERRPQHLASRNRHRPSPGSAEAPMKAIDHTFAEIELPKPAPAGRDLLVKVEAISVNPVDTKQRKQASGSRILGWDAAGTVEAVGREVTLF